MQNINIESSIYIFGLYKNSNCRQSNELNQNLQFLSKKYKTAICIIQNKCDLYDDFRIHFDYLLLYLTNMYSNGASYGASNGASNDASNEKIIKKIKPIIYINGSNYLLNANNIFTAIIN